MTLRARAAIFGLVLLAGLAPVLGQEEAANEPASLVDNPMYKAWAKFPVGARTLLAGTVQIGALSGEQPTKLTQTINYELLEVTPEKVVIRVSTRVWNGPQMTNYPVQKITYPAKTAAGTEGVLSGDDGHPEVLRVLREITLKKDKVSYQGKTIEATLKDYTYDLYEKDQPGPVQMATKEWYLDEVPGGLWKSESTGEGPLKTSSKMQLSSSYVPTGDANSAGGSGGGGRGGSGGGGGGRGGRGRQQSTTAPATSPG